MKYNNRKKRDRRLREVDILKASERVFATKGYHNATISDIAEESQYAVGTIYLYFKDKEALYLTLIEKKVENLIADVKRKLDEIKDPKLRIDLLIKEHFSYFEENEDFFRIYFSERGGVRWTIRDKISRSAVERLAKYIDYISLLIKNAQAKGIIKKELEPKMTAAILIGMMNATIFPWLMEKNLGKRNLSDLAVFVKEVFYKGVSAK